MDNYAITLNGESAELSWKKGKIHAEGYNLENEKIYLALNGGLGHGIGTLLVAIDEYFLAPVTLKKHLKYLEINVTEIIKEVEMGTLDIQDQYLSDMFYQYASFSPWKELRVEAARRGNFRKKGIERLMRNGEGEVITGLLWENKVPRTYYPRLAMSTSLDIRMALATRGD